ncbi:MAG: gliding motility-associated C-terminal domain-containing protein [Lewinella sp.]
MSLLKNLTCLRRGLCFIAIFAPVITVFAQEGNCNNVGFEFGTSEGYQTFTGRINRSGALTIDTPGPSEEQHRIMRITDGFDPIAMMNCVENNELSVVPSGAGQYAMRLGNPSTGARAERVLLQLNVTQERTFFLLSYAVILNDPGHEDFEQPRFELRILSSTGEVLDCGEYKVRASENIEGFENCGSWRVRPWTTAGFELQSYLGQDIQIEILTSDCSQGGHAGYAYFDASCQPLELQLEGYCPGTTSARLIVTEGFDRYLWSTGDTTSSITIIDPMAGAAYAVTVTSATGCTLTLSDTLPELEELPTPTLDEVPDTTLCIGNSIWMHPSGENFNSVFSPTLGFGADSFLLAPLANTTYLFTVVDDYGCKRDTLFYTVNIDSISTIVAVSDVVIDSTSCSDSSDGSISLVTNANSLIWETGDTSNSIQRLSVGDYEVTLTDQFGCFIDRTYSVVAPTPLLFGPPEITNVRCFGESNGALTVAVSGGTSPYRFSGEADLGDRLELTELSSGVYEVEATDRNGCRITDNFRVSQPEALIVDAFTDSVVCYGQSNGIANAVISGGTVPYSLAWDGSENQEGLQATGFMAGTHSLTVTDQLGCVTTKLFDVEEPLPIRIEERQTDSTSCHDSTDGTAFVISAGGNGGYSYVWNDPQGQATQQATGLSSATYTVMVTDRKGCEFEDSVTVPAPLPLLINLTQDSVRCYGGDDGVAIASPSGGNGGYDYVWQVIGARTARAQMLTAANYVVEVTDRKGCEESGNITVGQPDPIQAAVVGQDFPDCEHLLPGTTEITATGGNGNFTYLWATGSQTNTVSSFDAEEYAVTITDGKGCELMDTFEVRRLRASITANGPFLNNDMAICLGGELQLTANANTIISNTVWSSTQQIECESCDFITLIPEDSAYYQLIVMDENQCTDTASVFIPVNQFFGDIIVDATLINDRNGICFGDEVSMRLLVEPGAERVLWESSPTIDCLDCEEIVIRPESNETFRVVIDHVNGCQSELTSSVEVNRTACAQFIPNAFSPNGDGVNDRFTVPSSKAGIQIISMAIHDRYGGQLYLEKNTSFTDDTRGWDGTFKGKKAAVGVYVYLIEIEYFDGTKDIFEGDVMLLR